VDHVGGDVCHVDEMCVMLVKCNSPTVIHMCDLTHSQSKWSTNAWFMTVFADVDDVGDVLRSLLQNIVSFINVDDAGDVCYDAEV